MSWNPRGQATEFLVTFKRLHLRRLVLTASVQESAADVDAGVQAVFAVCRYVHPELRRDLSPNQ
jgi:hypothetical protein